MYLFFKVKNIKFSYKFILKAILNILTLYIL
jgi:hypothetical protein